MLISLTLESRKMRIQDAPYIEIFLSMWIGGPGIFLHAFTMLLLKMKIPRNSRLGLSGNVRYLSPPFTCGLHRERSQFLVLGAKNGNFWLILMSAGILFQLSITLTLKKFLLSSSLTCRIFSCPSGRQLLSRTSSCVICGLAQLYVSVFRILIP
jgi:hypothetical protein